ncbi:hypothetical protein EXS71_01585 [Candidatus Uhrbacteria bacterium]|nr:hypothetical protein [Candidatus Uhrbacteria bacterium]
MESRLANLLRAVVDEYIETAEPVGSQSLVERYGLEVSPATIRNWFTELEAEGYLMQPHTSGGRIPTEKGFKTYIKLFVQSKPAAKREEQFLRKATAAPSEEDRQLKNMAKALAELSGGAAVVGLPDAETFYTGLPQLFAQPEFHDWQRVVSLTEMLDRLDETFRLLRQRSLPEPYIAIGRESYFGSACGAIFGSFDGNVIGILGPIRMDYQRNISLLHTALELLDL